MNQCKATTREKTRCSKSIKKNSDFCGIHKNYDPNRKTLDEIRHNEIKEELGKSFKWSLGIFLLGIIISLFLFYVGIQNSIELSEETINQTILINKPVELKVDSVVDEKEGRWNITITNMHPTKATGDIFLYKLETNPDKPNTPLNKSLGPGESETFSLTFKTRDYNVSFTNKDNSFGGKTTIIPYSKLYYVYDHISISVRITCEECYSQGKLLRLPEFSSIPVQMIISDFFEGPDNVQITSYEWVDFDLNDVVLNSSR